VGLPLHQASQEHQLRVLAAAAAVHLLYLVFLLAAAVVLATVEQVQIMVEALPLILEVVVAAVAV
jgi:hypothetical protein